MDPIVVTLDYPVPLGDGEGKLTSLTFTRRPKVRDLVFAEQYGSSGDQAFGAALAASLAGVALDLVQEIDTADFKKVAKTIGILEGNAKSADGDVSPS